MEEILYSSAISRQDRVLGTVKVLKVTKTTIVVEASYGVYKERGVTNKLSFMRSTGIEKGYSNSYSYLSINVDRLLARMHCDNISL